MKNTNKIKSIICVLLVFSMLCVTFTGCSSKKDDDTVAEVDKKTEETIYTNRINNYKKPKRFTLHLITPVRFKTYPLPIGFTPTPPRFTSEMLRTLKM